MTVAAPQKAAAFLEQARNGLEARYGDKASLDDIVSRACHLMLEAAGVRDGCTVEVTAGRHAGLRFIPAVISWSEAEVGWRRSGDRIRYFGLWGGPTFRVAS